MIAKKTFILLSLILCLMACAYSQVTYVNTAQAIYKLEGDPGNCNRIVVANECGMENSILSIAVHNDTIYYNTWSGELKRFRPGVPGSCETLIQKDFSYTSMTIDRNGIIYSGTELLVRYDPRTNKLTHLGRMPFFSGGDMIFYKDKLLLAGSDPADWSTGIFEINPDNLSASKLYMKTPEFIGLIGYPTSCGKSRHFGLASNNTANTRIVELDLERKITKAEVCSIPLNILDAASDTHAELNISTIVKTKPGSCDQADGRILILTGTHTLPANFTLINSGVSNLTGEFTHLKPGVYTFRISNAGGCIKDTTVDLTENTSAARCNEIFVPNAFTPNGDGKNDLFAVYIPPAFRDVNLQVFSRWGTMVHHSKGGKIAWDGNYNGTAQSAGVFVYSLHYLHPDGKREIIKGTLNLIR